jgi:hypothetical protein
MVAIPQGLDSTALVRCPLCGAEYPLNEAMELIPPELIPVAASDEAILIDISQPISEADQQEADVIPLESAAIKPIPIHASIKSPPADAASNIDAPPIVPSFLLQYGATAKGEESSHPNFALEETAETTESPLDDEVFSLIAKHKEEVKKESPNLAEPLALQRRGQRKPKSVLRIFIEIVSGGLVGITIAYIALAWIMGSRFDLPRPPKFLKPVMRFVLPDRIWQEKELPRKNP